MSIHNDDSITPAAGPREKWVTPALTILAADSAELAVGAVDDNADFS